MAKPAASILLDESEREELERIRRSQAGAAGLSRRAQAVLWMADDIPGVEIARRTGYSAVQISRIRSRFVQHRVAGLQERARSGRPRKVTDKTIARVVALTLREPPAGISHWSARDLAAKTGLSHMTVHRIWKDHGLKPHRLETFKFSTDPEAESKIRDIVGLYLNPPDNAAVLCLDEKTQIQALERTQPLLPLRENLPARQTHDYRRNGLTSLYAALEIARGSVLGECSQQHTAVDFLRFLKKIARRYRGELHVILDNSSTHKTPAIVDWLNAHPRVHFHFTPTGASWLNLVEVWFSILTRRSIRRGSFQSVRSLIRHIEAYIEHWNENPIPFVWTKTADDVISKAVRH
jgi:transposase